MIKIPETIQKVHKDKSIKAIALLDSKSEFEEVSFEEYQNFIQAKLFVHKLKVDYWILCRQLWEKVYRDLLANWEVLKGKKINWIKPLDEEGCFDFCADVNWQNEAKAYNASYFCVTYPLEDELEILFGLQIDWIKQGISTYCSLVNENETAVVSGKLEHNIVVEDIDEDEADLSKYMVPLAKDEISDEDIRKLQEAVNEVITLYQPSSKKKTIKK